MFHSHASRRAVCVLLALLSNVSIAKTMSFDKQIQLSTAHKWIEPHALIRASNGDLIVAGSNEELGSRPWATRITSNGDIRWDFVEGASDNSPDRKIPQQTFKSVMELPDRTVILCGRKYENNSATVILDHIDVDGSLLEQRVVHPSRLMTN